MIEFNLPEESPVTIYVNDENVATFMCTPEHLKELAVGYLITSGIIQSMKDILILRACDEEQEIYVNAPNATLNGNKLKQMITSGCGSGMNTIEKLNELPKVDSEHTVRLDEIQTNCKKMIQKADKYKEHGAIHSSALISENFFVAMEDIGRHNAQDKVTGYAAMRDVDFSKSMIITTGRISTDMVYKAVNSNIPIICSLSNTTTLAVEMANQCNITIVCRILRPSMAILTNKERIKI